METHEQKADLAPCKFKVGDQVKVISGPFEGNIGQITSIHSHRVTKNSPLSWAITITPNSGPSFALGEHNLIKSSSN